jgi:hypothetical protein
LAFPNPRTGLIAVALVACAPARPAEPAPDLSSQPAPEGGEGTGAAARDTHTAADVTPSQLVQLAARPKAWPMSAEAAERYLAPLGEARRREPHAEALTLEGGASPVVSRFEVSYTGGSDASSFTSASFFLASEDPLALWQDYEALLTAELGAPAWKRDNGSGEAPSAGWNLGGAMELVLAPSPSESEGSLLLSISEPEGEAE